MTGAKQNSFTKEAMVLLGTGLQALRVMVTTSVLADHHCGGVFSETCDARLLYNRVFDPEAWDYCDYNSEYPNCLGGYLYSNGYVFDHKDENSTL